MKMGMSICFLAAFIVGIVCPSVYAEGWYAGAEGGYVTHTFKVHYEYVQGGTPDDYTDRAYGALGGLLGGYQFALMERLSLGVQGRVSFDNAEWTLATDEPADLSFSLPWAYSVSLLPEWRVLERLSIFAELGVGQGLLQQKKEASEASRYDATEWIPAYTFGGGLRYQLDARWQVFVQYRQARYGKTSFDSHLPDGTPWERIGSEASSEVFSAGLACSFGAAK